jgi:putative addiction module component (TIGR02574 family)
MKSILDEALKLSVRDRIRLADALYKSAVDPTSSFPLTDTQIAELERRLEDYKKNPGDNFSWGEVRRRALLRK